MSKKKRFGISEDATVGLAQTIALVENNPGKFRNTSIPLANIIVDPKNPRELALEPQDIENGIDKNDPTYIQKKQEYESIFSLSKSIEKDALLQPIVVYKSGEKYQIVTGERRFLASLIAKTNHIEARVYINKPNPLELKSAQWVENNQRQDLSLNDRMNNIRDLIQTYEESHQNQCSATILSTLTGLSLSQSSAYINLLKSSEDIKSAICTGEIDNIHKALVINNIKSIKDRNEALLLCKQGASLSEVKRFIKQRNELSKTFLAPTKSTLGRKPTTVKLGNSSDIGVVEKIIMTFAENAAYKEKISPLVSELEEMDYKSASALFKRFLKLIEE